MADPRDILLLPVGSAGDVHPYIPLARELLRRGHRVAMMANPHFEAVVSEAGVPMMPLGSEEQFLRVSRNPDVWDPWKGFEIVFGMSADAMGENYEAVMKWASSAERPVVAASALAFGARVAHEKHRLPLATVHLQPTVFRSVYEVPVLPGTKLPRRLPRWLLRGMWWWLDRFKVDPVVAGRINAFRAELGLPPVRGIIADWWHSPQMVIGLFPEWYAPPPPDWPSQLHLTGFVQYDRSDGQLPEEVARFLDDGPPPVVLTAGSLLRPDGEHFAKAAEACRLLGRRAVVVTPHADRVPPLPAGSACFDYVPYSQLFPRSAVVVHHGGIGTSAQAMRAGVPQLVTPFAHDQPDNAARLRRLGVADAVDPRSSKFRAPELASVLGRLIESGAVADACRAAAARFEGVDAVGETCDLIEQLDSPPA